MNKPNGTITMAANRKQNGLFEDASAGAEMAAAGTPTSEQSFEKSLDRLAKIVETLERDATSLADAMKLYEEGVALAQACRKELESAEMKITELRARAEGGYEEIENYEL